MRTPIITEIKIGCFNRTKIKTVNSICIHLVKTIVPFSVSTNQLKEKQEDLLREKEDMNKKVEIANTVLII